MPSPFGKEVVDRMKIDDALSPRRGLSAAVTGRDSYGMTEAESRFNQAPTDMLTAWRLASLPTTLFVRQLLAVQVFVTYPLIAALQPTALEQIRLTVVIPT